MSTEHDPRWRRWLVSGLIGIVVTALTAGCVINRGANQDDRSGVNESLVEVLIPNLCGLNTLVEDKELTKSSRYFWDSVHFNTHVLVSLLLQDHREQALAITRAKATVEADMRILSPKLATSVPKLLQSVRTGIKSLGKPGSDAMCSGQPPTEVP